MSKMIRFALFSTLFVQSTLANIFSNNGPITATSDVGISLLSKARKLSGNDEYNYWIGQYSIVFEKCHTVLNSGLNADEGDKDAYNGAGFALTGVVEFRLCPSDYCASQCYGGLYAVGVQDYVRALMESKRRVQEEECEAARENCYYDDENVCFQNAGLDYCVEDENEDRDNIDRYMECERVEEGDDGNENGNYYNYGYQCYNEDCELFVGPVCSTDGSAIYLSTFIDEECSAPAPDGAYEERSNGNSLPYSSDSIVNTDCVPCLVAQEQNEDGEVENEISELCMQLYEDSIKCESNVTDSYYQVTSGCYYIQEMLPKFAEFAAANDFASMVYWSVLPVMTLAFAGLSKYFHSKLQRTQVKLSDDGIGNGVVA